MDESNAAASKMADGEVSDGRAVEVSGEDTLPGVLRSFVDGVCSPGAGGEPLLRRLRAASCESAPRLREASRNSARDLLAWTRRGSGLRAILVISLTRPLLLLIALNPVDKNFERPKDRSTRTRRCLGSARRASARACWSHLLILLMLLRGWNDYAHSTDWTADFHVLPAGCDYQCHCGFSPHVLGSCWRIPGYVLCLLSCSVCRSSISCYFHHLGHGYLGHCWSHDCYRLDRILLDDLVCCKEGHGPYKALDRHDNFGYAIIFNFSAGEAEAYRLRRTAIQLQLRHCRAT